MAHPDDLYRAIDETMPEASSKEVKNEYLRVSKALAEGDITEEEIQQEYGIAPNELDGYDVDQSRSEQSMPEVTEQPVLEPGSREVNETQLEPEASEDPGNIPETNREYRDEEMEIDMGRH